MYRADALLDATRHLDPPYGVVGFDAFDRNADTDHLDFVESVVGTDGPPIRVCLDLDASLRLLRGAAHLRSARSRRRSSRSASCAAPGAVM